MPAVKECHRFSGPWRITVLRVAKEIDSFIVTTLLGIGTIIKRLHIGLLYAHHMHAIPLEKSNYFEMVRGVGDRIFCEDTRRGLGGAGGGSKYFCHIIALHFGPQHSRSP